MKTKKSTSKRWQMFLISCALALLLPAGMSAQSQADASLSTIEVFYPQRVVADGVSYETVLVRLRTEAGIPISSGGDKVEIFLSNNTGILTSVTDNNNGTYSAYLSSNTVGSDELSFKVNDVLSPSTITVVYYIRYLDAERSYLEASPTVIEADGVSTSSIWINLIDTAGHGVGGTGNENVVFSLKQPALGSIGSVTYDGHYRVTLTSPASVGSDEISFSIDGVQNSTPISIEYGNNVPSAEYSRVTVDTNSILADETTTATITVTLYDKNNNRITTRGAQIKTTSMGSITNIRDFIDNGDGTHTVLLSGRNVGTDEIYISVNNVRIPTPVAMTYTAADGITDAEEITYKISASPSVIEADGEDIAHIFIEAYNKDGRLHAGIFPPVTVYNTGEGTLLEMHYYDASYTFCTINLKAPTNEGTDTLSFAVNGVLNENKFVLRYEKGAPNYLASLITAGNNTLPADGKSTTTITISLRDKYGNPVNKGEAEVRMDFKRYPANGSLSAVTNHENGTYTATLTAPTVPGVDTIFVASVNGLGNLSNNIAITYTEVLEPEPEPEPETVAISVEVDEAIQDCVTVERSWSGNEAPVGEMVTLTIHIDGACELSAPSVYMNDLLIEPVQVILRAAGTYIYSFYVTGPLNIEIRSEDNTTGIDNIQPNVQLSAVPGFIHVETQMAGDLRIYTYMGSLYKQLHIPPGITTIPAAKGLYLVVFKDKVVKIVVK
jgi:adhesin/invasin